eukprot:1195515-Prorocentrum_minimum.AAC.16
MTTCRLAGFPNVAGVDDGASSHPRGELPADARHPRRRPPAHPTGGAQHRQLRQHTVQHSRQRGGGGASGTPAGPGGAETV